MHCELTLLYYFKFNQIFHLTSKISFLVWIYINLNDLTKPHTMSSLTQVLFYIYFFLKHDKTNMLKYRLKQKFPMHYHVVHLVGKCEIIEFSMVSFGLHSNTK